MTGAEGERKAGHRRRDSASPSAFRPIEGRVAESRASSRNWKPDNVPQHAQV